MDTKQTAEQRIEELETAVAALGRQVGILEDVNAIRHLQYKYGYFIDKCLYNETVDLFADDGEVRFMGGIYKGKKGISRLYCQRFRGRFTDDVNGVVYGFLLDHPQMQAIIDVAPDRMTARLRGRSMMQAGRHVSVTAEGELPRQWFEGGIYENEYVKEDGIWKIKVLDYNPVWHGMYDKGWAYMEPNAYPFASKTFPEDPLGPDALATEPYRVLWPDTSVVPFHYVHPVTGKPVVPQKAVAKAK